MTNPTDERLKQIAEASTPKPCPFCGGSPRVLRDTYVETLRPELYPEGGRSWVVCGCEAGNKFNLRAEALAAWNARAPDPTVLTLLSDKAALEAERWNRQRACDAAQEASAKFGQWIPQRWLDLFFAAYEAPQ